MSDTQHSNRPTVLLDACTLVPYRLASSLMWLAEAGLFELLWSDAILAETEKALVGKLDVPPAKASYRIGKMREAFGPAALVEDFQALVPSMTCDAKDRHVLAAAVAGGADVLLTFNIKDFPDSSLEGHGIRVRHPDFFLMDLLAHTPGEVLEAIGRGVAQLKNPPMMLRQWLVALTSTVSRFASLAADALEHPQGAAAPVPALVTADDEEAIAAFGEIGDLTNPAQVALLWMTALSVNLDAARNLSTDPEDWGDYKEAIAAV